MSVNFDIARYPKDTLIDLVIQKDSQIETLKSQLEDKDREIAGRVDLETAAREISQLMEDCREKDAEIERLRSCQ